MHSNAVVAALLGLLLSVPGVISASFGVKMKSPEFLEEIKTSIVLQPKESRKLQGDVVSTYTSIWYFVHSGVCEGTEEPTVSLNCTNGGIVTLTAVSQYPSCIEPSDSELLCTTNAAKSTGHAVEFTCAGKTMEDTIASASITEQTSDCLGGGGAADWGNGILLALNCGDNKSVHNGTCDPLNSTFPDYTCTSGYTCDFNCTVRNYSLPEMTSFITNSDCSKYVEVEDHEASGCSSTVTVLSTVFAVASAMIVFSW